MEERAQSTGAAGCYARFLHQLSRLPRRLVYPLPPADMALYTPCCCAVQVMRRYHIQDRDDYKKYNKLCGMVTKVTSIIKKLDARDATRIELTDQLLDKCAGGTAASLMSH
jgi:Ribosomal protein S4/S9 N-terminal domain